MPLKILIVEDEFLIALDVQTTVEDAGHVVCGLAYDRAGAGELMREQTFDLAFVDLHLRDGATGAQIGRALTAAGIPVVYMSANGNELPGDLYGALARIDKPCTADTLVTMLRRVSEHVSDHVGEPVGGTEPSECDSSRVDWVA